MSEPSPDFSEYGGLCAAVRTTCRRVVEHATLVSIDDDRLGVMAEELGAVADRAANTAPPVPASIADREATATLVFALDAVNFGSGYHDIVRKLPGLSGARSMERRFRGYVAVTGPMSGPRLRSIRIGDASQIFGQELDGGALEELMMRFTIALNDLGAWFESFGDSALAAVEASGRSAERLATSLLDMPFYRDVEHHPGDRTTDDADGFDVHFYKRAQITAADLDRALGRQFDDLDTLTAFADNLVPHVLRVDGALRFDDELAQTIDRRQRLRPGGVAEVEIRAAGVEAVERLSALTDRSAGDLDLALWTRGGEARYKAVPRHRARSVFY